MNTPADNTPADLPQNQPATASAIRQRSGILRFFRWLFTPRILGRLLAVILTVLTLMVLFYVEEKIRGRWAWNRYKQTLASQGISMDLKTIIPPALAPEKNFARAPLLKPLYEGVSQQKRADTEELKKFSAQFNRPQELAATLGYAYVPTIRNEWRKGAWPDPIKMLGEHQKTPAGPPFVPPASPELAAELIVDIYRKTTGPLLDELQTESLARPYCNFDLNYETDDPFSIVLHYLPNFKALGQQSATRAMAELYLKQSEAGFRDTLFCLHMSETLKDDPLLISFLVGVALREIALNPVWYGLATRQWTPAQLEQLQNRLEALNLMTQTTRALNAERLLGQRGIDGLARRFPDKILFSDMGDVITDDTRSKNKCLEKCLSYLYPKGWFYFESINYQRLFLKNFHGPIPANRPLDLTAFDAANESISKELGGSGLQCLWQHKLLAGMMLPALGKVYHKAANSQMASTMAATACALERFRLAHGQYPRQLAELTPKYLKEVPYDLISGAPLKYQLNADGAYLMYSFGRNGVDDGGTVALTKSGSVNVEEGDWVWKYPASR